MINHKFVKPKNISSSKKVLSTKPEMIVRQKKQRIGKGQVGVATSVCSTARERWLGW